MAAQVLTLVSVGLKKDFRKLVAGFDGRVGVCAQTKATLVCPNAGRIFSMQSVMKMLVGMSMMKQDLSLYMQPIDKPVGPDGYESTIGELVRRAIVDNDSAATDILLARLGGPDVVKKLLERNGINGIQLDRDESHLQTAVGVRNMWMQLCLTRHSK